LYEQMREGAANARKEQQVKKNRWPVLVGLLAAGAAVGAAGAMVARRRRTAAQWDEYDPMPAVSDASYGSPSGSSAAASKMSSATDKVTTSAANVAESVSSQAGKVADSLHEKSSGRGSTPDKAARKASDIADDTAP
jgi:cytoskeletal protein RodZ